jgi:sporulation-control protein spo0M
VKRKSTLRKLPPKTREIARMLNELESVSKRLANRLEAMAELEKQSVAWEVMNRMVPEDHKKLQAILKIAELPETEKVELKKWLDSLPDRVSAIQRT